MSHSNQPFKITQIFAVENEAYKKDENDDVSYYKQVKTEEVQIRRDSLKNTLIKDLCKDPSMNAASLINAASQRKDLSKDPLMNAASLINAASQRKDQSKDPLMNAASLISAASQRRQLIKADPFPSSIDDEANGFNCTKHKKRKYIENRVKPLNEAALHIKRASNDVSSALYDQITGAAHIEAHDETTSCDSNNEAQIERHQIILKTLYDQITVLKALYDQIAGVARTEAHDDTISRDSNNEPQIRMHQTILKVLYDKIAVLKALYDQIAGVAHTNNEAQIGMNHMILRLHPWHLTQLLEIVHSTVSVSCIQSLRCRKLGCLLDTDICIESLLGSLHIATILALLHVQNKCHAFREFKILGVVTWISWHINGVILQNQSNNSSGIVLELKSEVSSHGIGTIFVGLTGAFLNINNGINMQVIDTSLIIVAWHYVTTVNLAYFTSNIKHASVYNEEHQRFFNKVMHSLISPNGNVTIKLIDSTACILLKELSINPIFNTKLYNGSYPLQNGHKYKVLCSLSLKQNGNDCINKKAVSLAIKEWNKDNEIFHISYYNIAMCLYHRTHFNKLLITTLITCNELIQSIALISESNKNTVNQTSESALLNRDSSNYISSNKVKKVNPVRSIFTTKLLSYEIANKSTVKFTADVVWTILDSNSVRNVVFPHLIEGRQITSHHLIKSNIRRDIICVFIGQAQEVIHLIHNIMHHKASMDKLVQFQSIKLNPTTSILGSFSRMFKFNKIKHLLWNNGGSEIIHFIAYICNSFDCSANDPLYYTFPNKPYYKCNTQYILIENSSFINGRNGSWIKVRELKRMMKCDCYLNDIMIIISPQSVELCKILRNIFEYKYVIGVYIVLVMGNVIEAQQFGLMTLESLSNNVNQEKSNEANAIIVAWYYVTTVNLAYFESNIKHESVYNEEHQRFFNKVMHSLISSNGNVTIKLIDFAACILLKELSINSMFNTKLYDGSYPLQNSHKYNIFCSLSLKQKGNDCINKKAVSIAIKEWNKNNELLHISYYNIAMCLYHWTHFNKLLITTVITCYELIQSIAFNKTMNEQIIQLNQKTKIMDHHKFGDGSKGILVQILEINTLSYYRANDEFGTDKDDIMSLYLSLSRISYPQSYDEYYSYNDNEDPDQDTKNDAKYGLSYYIDENEVKYSRKPPNPTLDPPEEDEGQGIKDLNSEINVLEIAKIDQEKILTNATETLRLHAFKSFQTAESSLLDHKDEFDPPWPSLRLNKDKGRIDNDDHDECGCDINSDHDVLLFQYVNDMIYHSDVLSLDSNRAKDDLKLMRDRSRSLSVSNIEVSTKFDEPLNETLSTMPTISIDSLQIHEYKDIVDDVLSEDNISDFQPRFTSYLRKWEGIQCIEQHADDADGRLPSTNLNLSSETINKIDIEDHVSVELNAENDNNGNNDEIYESNSDENSSSDFMSLKPSTPPSDIINKNNNYTTYNPSNVPLSIIRSASKELNLMNNILDANDIDNVMRYKSDNNDDWTNCDTKRWKTICDGYLKSLH